MLRQCAPPVTRIGPAGISFCYGGSGLHALTSPASDSITLFALRSNSDPKLTPEQGASRRLLPSMELGLPSIWVWGVCRGVLLLAADEAHSLGVLCALC